MARGVVTIHLKKFVADMARGGFLSSMICLLMWGMVGGASQADNMGRGGCYLAGWWEFGSLSRGWLVLARFSTRNFVSDTGRGVWGYNPMYDDRVTLQSHVHYKEI